MTSVVVERFPQMKVRVKTLFPHSSFSKTEHTQRGIHFCDFFIWTGACVLLVGVQHMFSLLELVLHLLCTGKAQ